jgi:hypothetical protein
MDIYNQVSNCQPPVGLIKCIQTSSNDYSLGWLNSDIATLTLRESLKKRASEDGAQAVAQGGELRSGSAYSGSASSSSSANSSSSSRDAASLVNPDLASPIALLTTLDAQLKTLESERDAAKKKAMQLEAEVNRLKEVLAA